MGDGVFFKRWTRKGYSVFNSLNKEIRICMLNIRLKLLSPVLLSEKKFFSGKDHFNAFEQDMIVFLELDCITNSILKELLFQNVSSRNKEGFSYRYLFLWQSINYVDQRI